MMGFKEDEFWELTPAESNHRMRVAIKEDARRTDYIRTCLYSVAWLIDFNRRHQKIPSLTQQLNPPRQAKGEERKARQAEFDQLEREMGRR